MKNFTQKLFVGIVIFLLSNTNLFAQTSSNIESNLACKVYGVDFIVKNEPKVSIDILLQIDILPYLALRHENIDIEVYENITGKTLVIYSEEQMKVVREPIYNYSDFITESNQRTK